jgi:hypothetical protein
MDGGAHPVIGAAAAILLMELSISLSVGLGTASSNAATDMIIPAWQ